MTLPARIGSYPIERELGRGGMGIVYLGRDPKLDRPVAIKVLPEAFAHDTERLARFEREARVLASLTHPNVAGIYGVEESSGHRFLVLEYVEGETLAERLAHGPLPVDETIDVGRQIAAALEAAHEAGIVHRDLKPGNVKLTPAGEVKVLDFGLARGGAASAASDPSLSASPTMATAMTSAGVILGTAAYMSPEQARGRAVDRRTDIWSFGCVLFECLTGRQAFSGETVSDVIAVILQAEPDWKALPTNTPPHLRALIERCLTKDPKKRLRDIGEARLLLEGGSASLISSTGVPAASAGPAGSTRLPWIIAAIAAIAATAFGVLWARRAPDPLPVQRVSVNAPQTPFPPRDAVYGSLSPDGTRLVLAIADSSGSSTLWLRSLDSYEGRVLSGTAAVMSFWSPDGRYIGYFTQDKVMKLDLRGGTPEVLCPVTAYGRGGSWGSRGIIVFSGGAEGPIYKVREEGGDPEPATALDSTETGHRFPSFLPDGVHFLYAAMPPRQSQVTIYVGSTESTKREKLMIADGTPVYADPGYLVYGRNGRIVAQRFDAAQRRLSGEPLPLVDEPERTDFLGAPSFIAARRGPLLYYSRLPQINRLTWLDRNGREMGPLPIPPGPIDFAVLSPDNRRMVLRKTLSTQEDLWVYDFGTGSLNRLTHGEGRVDRPLWSPDGTRIAYSSDRDGRWDIFEIGADGRNESPVVTGGSLIKYPGAYTPDGRTLIFEQLSERTGWDLWTVSLTGDRKPEVLLQSPYDEQSSTLSHDGRWLAFTSNETGPFELYVQSFPQGTDRQILSSGGGLYPRWRADDGEIVFLTGAEVTYITVDRTGGLHRGATHSFPMTADIIFGEPNRDFSRILAIRPAGGSATTNDLSAVFHWQSELKRR